MSDMVRPSIDAMRNWLVLEGWVPYNDPKNAGWEKYTFSLNGKEGWFCFGNDRGNYTMVDMPVSREEVPMPIDDVPNTEIETMYAWATNRSAHESR